MYMHHSLCNKMYRCMFYTMSIKGGLHPYPGVAETLVTKVLH